MPSRLAQFGQVPFPMLERVIAHCFGTPPGQIEQSQGPGMVALRKGELLKKEGA
jgi:hypothetical protein